MAEAKQRADVVWIPIATERAPIASIVAEGAPPVMAAKAPSVISVAPATETPVTTFAFPNEHYGIVRLQ